MALTNKQRRFAEAKAAGASNREAAEAAGYAASSASAAGSRLAKHPDVEAFVEMLKIAALVNTELGDQAGGSPVGEMPDGDGEFLDSLPQTDDPLTWLLALMNEPRAKIFDRRNAAQKAVDYFHSKKGDSGKKGEKQAAAQKATGGRFGAAPPPPLHAVK
jgi:phage terminase small subunit|tara:strand:+ start:16 stop:495 length:480 start_codon:yes stop_codon:yes gene_type:complete